MVKLFAIAFSFLILNQSTNIGYTDILQLDAFIEHAQFHMNEYGDDFFVFLSKHYGDLKDEHHKKHEEEKPDHENLPFQQQSQIATIVVFIIETNTLEKQKPDYLSSSENHFYYQNNYSSLHNKGVFQPPKFV